MEHALAHPNDPPLPRLIEQEFRKILDQEHKQNQYLEEFSSAREEEAVEAELISSVSAVALSENEAWTSAAYRLASRENQLNSLVEIALQSLNERDEEGRTLPEELTERDVGRTVLRRAEEQDLPTLFKMFSSSDKKLSIADKSSASPRINGRESLEHTQHLSRTNVVSDTQIGESRKPLSNSLTSCLLSVESSSSFIVLLLCRAIAAYEHPPLGCAILNLGFSMERGRLLRVVRVASEPHLPRERFLEVLQKFSKTMKCGFEASSISSQNAQLSIPDLVEIVRSHVIADDEKPAAAKIPFRDSKRRSSQASFQQLQAVREEDDESGVSSEEKEDDENEDSDPIEKRSGISSTKQKRNSSKPSKRSRVK
jgi:hypothetical protein